MVSAKKRAVKKLRYFAFSADLLVKLRKENAMTQAQLAEASGLSQGAISNYENGEREPDTEALKKLGKVFGLFFVADWAGTHSDGIKN